MEPEGGTDKIKIKTYIGPLRIRKTLSFLKQQNNNRTDFHNILKRLIIEGSNEGFEQNSIIIRVGGVLEKESYRYS